MEIFKNNRFYPQNFFILKQTDTDIDAVIKEIVNKATSISPESFNSEDKYFIFTLQYQQPYIKAHEFREIRNLQVEAISHTRFKDEYDGYIGIDISEWVGCSDEEHFRNCIHVLKKMSSHWKYIFFAEGDFNHTDLRETVDAIRSEIWLQEISADEFAKQEFAVKLAKEAQQAHGVTLSVAAQDIIRSVFIEANHTKGDHIADIATDISNYFGSTTFISADDFIDYLFDETYARFVMSEEEHLLLNNVMNEWRARYA